MITRDQALHHSPALWALLAACAGEVLVVLAWNAWDRREQLVGRGVRALDRLRL